MSPEPLGGSCTSHYAGEVLVVALSGRLSGEAGAALLDWIPGARTDAPHVVVELSGLTAIDRAGANALLDARSATAARHGTLALAGPTPAVSETLRQFGVLGAVEVFADERMALEAVTRRRPTAPAGRRRDQAPLATSEADVIDRGPQGHQPEDPHDQPTGRRQRTRVR